MISIPQEAPLDSTAALLALLGACSSAPRELSRPNRIALGPDGLVYVSDFHHDRIGVFDEAGALVRTFGSQGIGRDELWRVTAMSVARDGALVVANRRPESDDRDHALRFELKRVRDGEEIARTVLDGRTLQADGWVDAMLESASGTWIIADNTHGELVEVDIGGQRVGRFGGIPRVDAAPSALVRDGDAVWVVEQNRHRISRIAPRGDEHTIVLRDDGHGLPRFPSAVGLCHAPTGDWLAVADLGNHRVQRYDLPPADRWAGAEIEAHWRSEFVPEPVGVDQPVQLMDLVVSPDCSRLYLVDSKGDRVLVTTPDGAVLQTLDRW